MHNVYVILSLLGVLLFCSISAHSGEKTESEYCSEPYSSLSPEEKKVLDETSINTVNAGKLSNLWETNVIPVIFHPDLKDDIKKAMQVALNKISEVSGPPLTEDFDGTRPVVGFHFYECTHDTLKENQEIRAYISIMPATHFYAPKKKICPEDNEGCVRGMGFQRRRTNSNVYLNSVILGLKSNKVGTSIHEILHALGLDHAHQSPVKEREISIDVGMIPKPGTGANQKDKDKYENRLYNCNSRTGYWIPNYDPASIMHYNIGVGKCNLQLKGCEATKTPVPNYEKIHNCTIEKVIKEGNVCNHTNSGTNECFKLPEKQQINVKLGTGKGILYSETDFGQDNCLSKMDQRWLYSVSKEITKIPNATPTRIEQRLKKYKIDTQAIQKLCTEL